jgi:drug/metabolite transporter (DMT)-like permease
MPGDRRHDLLASLALVWVAFMFGTSFVVVKAGLDSVDPVPYLFLRFGIAGAVFYVIGHRRPPDPRMRPLAWATALTYALAMTMQTAGLRTIDPASSAFLTYLLVVIVPIVVWVWHRQVPQRLTVAAIGLAAVGLVLLTGGGGGVSKGTLLTLGGAVAFAVHLVQMGVAAERGYDLIRFNALQCVGVAVMLGPLVPFTGGLPTEAEGWAVSIYAALFVTVLTMIPWMWAARRVPPTRAALVLLLEPVFAALASAATGQPLGAVALVGAVLILAAAALAELPALRRSRTLTAAT